MRINFKIILISFFLLFHFSFVSSQEIDSLKIFNSQYDSILYNDAYFLDVLFYKHHNDVLINNLGPFGSKYYFPIANGLFPKVYLSKDEENIYRKRLYQLKGIKPFTNITYINASRKEQLLLLNNVQQFGKLLSFSFDYKRISSPGIYLNQEANNTLFNAFLDYQSKNKIHSISFKVSITRDFFDENGGLKNKPDFESNLFDDRKTYDVNLLSSHTSEKKYHYQLKNRFRLWLNRKDSTEFNSLNLKWNTNYTDRKRVFNDNDPLSTIYNDIFIDSLSTVDSIHINILSNQLAFSFSQNKHVVDIYGIHELENYYQSYGLDTIYHNLYFGSSVRFSKDKLKFNIDGKYAFNGYREGDVEIISNTSYKLDTNYELKVGISYHLNEPSLNFINYQSNHFSWRNYHFKKMSTLNASVELLLKKIKTFLIVDNKLLTNVLYFDNQANASQLNESNILSSIRVAKNYRLLNFYFRSVLIYQSTAHKSIFPLPALIGRQIVYYQNFLFKKTLKFQLGFNVFYTSNYYGYAYMPATSKFYVQTDQMIGDYPYFDVFFNTQLKRARIFFKYEHFNAGWSGYRYYATAGYPAMDRSFKFGLSWNMFD